MGLDIGSTSTKAALVELSDQATVLHVEHRPTPATVSGLLSAVAAVLRACAAYATAPIAAVGIASMAESGAALDADGRELTGLVRWDRPVDGIHLDRLLQLRPDLPAATGAPATTKPAAVALLALGADRPETLRAMRHWCGVADLVAHALTGVRATDHTLAVRTMLAGADGTEWDEQLLADLGLSPDLLPQLRAPGEPAGRTLDAAVAFGLPSGIPVHIAGHDHAVGAWAVGARRPGQAADSLGTAEAVVRVASEADRAAAAASGFAVSRTVDATSLTVLGGSRACGALLACWDGEHPGSLGILAGESTEPWRTSSVTVLPYPSGRQCPDPDPHAGLRVIGDADPADRARGLLQSLVAHSRWMRETADELAGSASSSLVVLGSLAHRIPAWAPLAATAGIPTRVAETAEPVAVGAALLAAVRAGAASAELTLAATAVVPARAPGLEDAHRRFLDAVRGTAGPDCPVEESHLEEGES